MRFPTVAFAAATMFGLATASPPPAHAVGCFTGAVMGAIAGHLAGHGVLGGVGGCVAGHEWHKHQLRQDSLQSREDYVQHRKQQDPNYRDPWSQ